MMNIIDAKSTSINDIVYLVTDAVGAPIINRSKSACAVFESFISEGDAFRAHAIVNATCFVLAHGPSADIAGQMGRCDD